MMLCERRVQQQSWLENAVGCCERVVGLVMKETGVDCSEGKVTQSDAAGDGVQGEHLESESSSGRIEPRTLF
jgi:hypothetical protein